MTIELFAGIIFLVITFLATILATKIWIGIAKKYSLVGKDLNKYKKPLVAESGGMAVIIGFVISLFLYILFKIFYLKTGTNIVETLALVFTVFIAGFIGYGDDILGWKKGIKPWVRFLMTVPVAIPLILIKAGVSSMSIPFFGTIDFGLFFPASLINIP